jgi:hypothetical protein
MSGLRPVTVITGASAGIGAASPPEADGQPCREDFVPGDLEQAQLGVVDGDAAIIHGCQDSLDDPFRSVAIAVADVHHLAREALVLPPLAERALGSRRADLEGVVAIDEPGLLEDRAGDLAHPLAVGDRYPSRLVDGDPQCPAAGPQLLDRVDLIAQVGEGRLEEPSDLRYWPGRHGKGSRCS